MTIAHDEKMGRIMAEIRANLDAIDQQHRGAGMSAPQRRHLQVVGDQSETDVTMVRGPWGDDGEFDARHERINATLARCELIIERRRPSDIAKVLPFRAKA